MSASVSKQGLLRVAIENARAQEKQDQLERTELKMELVRERELRETLERQLSVEQKNRGRDTPAEAEAFIRCFLLKILSFLCYSFSFISEICVF